MNSCAIPYSADKSHSLYNNIPIQRFFQNEPIVAPKESLSMYSDVHGKCGIITACITDPLSQLVSKIMGLRENEVNSVGFYYESELHGINECRVILFNIYDNDPIPWLRLGYTMNLLLASPFVNKITYYPIVTSSDYNQSSLLSRSSMKSKPFNKKLEETFKAIVVQTIGINAKAIHDKNVSYTAMLLKSAGITGEDADRLVNSIITGYSLVNKILLTLMGIENADLNKISSSIVPCPLLRQPISITAPREINEDNDIKYIIEESRREITKLAAIFVDLFTTHQEFRSNIISKSFGKFDNNKALSNNLLEGLFMKESDLVTHLVGGLQNGIISTATINDTIRNLNIERFNLGNYQQLPITNTTKSNVQISDDTLMCTFQVPNNSPNINPLRDLGEYIQYITDSFNSPEPLTINWGGIIATYNNIIKDVSGSSLKKIVIPNVDMCTMSRNAVITIPGNCNSDGIVVPSSNSNLMIPMFGSNLTILTETQLMDILVYLDSLRTSDGTGDTRFASLQNEVTQELSLRAKR
jgi:hypothetical protein